MMKEYQKKAFVELMEKTQPSAKAFIDDFNQLSKKMEMLAPYMENKKEVSPFMAEKMEQALGCISVVYMMCKSESEGEY